MQTVATAAPEDELPVGDLSAATRLVDQIDAAEFDLSFRGYRPDQVNQLLEQVREQVLELGSGYVQSRREADALRMRLQHEHQRLQAAPPPPPPAPPPPGPAGGTISRQVERLLEQAQRLVTAQYAGAAARADEIVAAAELAAAEITAEAQEQAGVLLDEARRRARHAADQAEEQQVRARSLQDDLHATLQAAFQAVSALRDSVDSGERSAAATDDDEARSARPPAPPVPTAEDDAGGSPDGRWSLAQGPGEALP